jgi:tetratricopeptide (TPR) repeat protein
MSWQEGYFSFTELNIDDSPADSTTSVTTESLLMEGARRIDEWERIQHLIPHLGVVPVLADVDAEHPSALDLRPNEWEVLAAVDGTSDLRGVAAALGRSDFEVARVAYGLVATGIVRVEEPEIAPAEPSPPPELATLLNDARESLREGRPGDALSFAATAVALAPDDAEGRVLLARALIQGGRDREGDEELRRALESEPRNLPALAESARVAARRGDFGQAIEFWQRIIAAAPSSPAATRARDAITNASRLSAVLEAADA